MMADLYQKKDEVEVPIVLPMRVYKMAVDLLQRSDCDTFDGLVLNGLKAQLQKQSPAEFERYVDERFRAYLKSQSKAQPLELDKLKGNETIEELSKKLQVDKGEVVDALMQLHLKRQTRR